MAENQDTGTANSSSSPQSEPAGSNEQNEATVSEAIRKLSGKKPEAVEQFIAMGMGSLGNPLHHKMNEKHISTVLDLAVKHDEREFQLARGQQQIQASNRWFTMVIFIVIVLTVLVLILSFRDKPDILVPLVTAIVAFGGGFGSGFGYSKWRSD